MRGGRIRVGVVAAAVLAGQLVVGPQEVAATGIVVTTQSDAVAADGKCSLREAIIASNTMNPSNECPAGGASVDTVTFQVAGTITLTSNLPHLTKGLTIEGGGITIDGASSYQPFYVESGELNLRFLTITNGFGAFGGAVANGGTVSMRRVTIRSSDATFGGGVHNNGTMSIAQSTIEGNSASSAGGGIYNEDQLLVSNSTIAGNTSDEGGGVYQSLGQLNANHVTVTRNAADSGAGVKIAGGTSIFGNSLILANTGAETSGGNYAYSLVQASSSGVLDPNGLQDNGGPTRTIRLLKGSNPALNLGDPDWCNAAGYIDQRGVPRPNGSFDKCDAGALQLDRAAPNMSAPNVYFRSGVTLDGTSSRARVVFAATDGGTGVERFSLQRQVNGGSWTSISTTIPPFLLTSAGDPVAIAGGTVAPAGLFEAGGVRNVTLTKDNSYRFRVRAIDEDGNVSGWRYTPTVTAKLYQQTSSAMGYTSGWSTASSSKFSGGSVRLRAGQRQGGGAHLHRPGGRVRDDAARGRDGQGTGCTRTATSSRSRR